MQILNTKHVTANTLMPANSTNCMCTACVPLIERTMSEEFGNAL